MYLGTYSKALTLQKLLQQALEEPSSTPNIPSKTLRSGPKTHEHKHFTVISLPYWVDMGCPYPHFCLCAFLGPYKKPSPKAPEDPQKSPLQLQTDL